MASPAVVTRASYGDSTSGTSHSVTLPASIVSGNLLVLVAGYSSAATLTTPSGWTLLTSYTSSPYEYIYYKVASGSEGSTVAVTSSGSVVFGAVAWQISGWDGNAPQFGTIATGSSATPNPPSVTPTSTDSLALALCGGSGAPSTTQTISSYPSGYSNGQIGAGTTGTNRGFSASAEATISGTSPVDPGTFTLGNPTSWWAQTVIVNSPPAALPPLLFIAPMIGM